MFPFACDSRDDIFEASVGAGRIVVARSSASNVVDEVSDDLIPITVHGIGGTSSTYADPGVVALLPDANGGVWVVSEVGSNPSTNVGSAYPTLAHATYAT